MINRLVESCKLPYRPLHGFGRLVSIIYYIIISSTRENKAYWNICHVFYNNYILCPTCLGISNYYHASSIWLLFDCGPSPNFWRGGPYQLCKIFRRGIVSWSIPFIMLTLLIKAIYNFISILTITPPTPGV